MLKICAILSPFFEDTFRQISVREYAREKKVSPPHAAKMLRMLERENILLSKQQGIYLYFRVNKEQYIFLQLVKMYWFTRLFEITEELHEEIAYRGIFLFGSLAKGENTKESDIDIYLDTEKKELDTFPIEKKMKRKVQLHFISSKKNEHLKKNIEQGIRIR